MQWPQTSQLHGSFFEFFIYFIVALPLDNGGSPNFVYLHTVVKKSLLKSSSASSNKQ
jgi:hypothetical protein